MGVTKPKIVKYQKTTAKTNTSKNKNKKTTNL